MRSRRTQNLEMRTHKKFPIHFTCALEEQFAATTVASLLIRGEAVLVRVILGLWCRECVCVYAGGGEGLKKFPERLHSTFPGSQILGVSVSKEKLVKFSQNPYELILSSWTWHSVRVFVWINFNSRKDRRRFAWLTSIGVLNRANIDVTVETSSSADDI